MLPLNYSHIRVLPRTLRVKDLRLRHHRRTDLTDLATALHFVRTDLAAVMVFVEAHEDGVVVALVTFSDWHSTFGLPAVRETALTEKLHHSKRCSRS